MSQTVVGRSQAQSFDSLADAYDRLAELGGTGQFDPWLTDLLPVASGRALDLGCGTGRHAALLAERFASVDAVDLSGPMIELARARRAAPGIVFRQADLLDVEGSGQYDFVLSVLTLHHVADLHAALDHVKSLLAPGGRLVIVDMYPTTQLGPLSASRRVVQRLVPLRPRLHAMAAVRFARNLPRRGPATAWEIYRLSVRREWLDHLVSDRFFSREELERSCGLLFPGARLEAVGARRRIGLVWDAPASTAIR